MPLGTSPCKSAILQEQILAMHSSDAVGLMGIYKTLKGNLLHVESEAEKGQIEVDIDIQKVAPKFNGTIQKNQSRYERKRQLYDAAQGIIRKLPS